jgi:hypothetical protein
MIKRILRDTCAIGAALTGTTTLAVLAASGTENAGSWGAINSVSHIVDGDDVQYENCFSVRDSLIGLGINSTAMFSWAFLYSGLFGSIRWPKTLLSGTAMAAAAYVTDYYIVPKRYTPGIEKKIGPKSIFVVYAIIAITLALSPLYCQKKRK